MRKKLGLFGMVLAALLFTAGCGQQLKQENEQLKGQISTLTEENNGLKNQVATLQKEAEDLKNHVTSLTAERDAAKKELEARAKKPAPAKPAAKKKRK